MGGTGVERILIVEDESETATTICDYLTKQGYECETQNDGISSVQSLMRSSFHLVVLDWMIPGLDGLEVCRIAKSIRDTKVLMVSAKSRVADKVVGLEVGVDDYITKPFSLREMNARIRVLLRRSQHLEGQNRRDSKESFVVYVEGNRLTVNPRGYTASINGFPLPLTVAEMRILFLLVDRAGGIVTKDEMADAIYDGDSTADLHVLTVHISNLRKKLASATGRGLIKSLYGVGYKLEVTPALPQFVHPWS